MRTKTTEITPIMEFRFIKAIIGTITVSGIMTSLDRGELTGLVIISMPGHLPCRLTRILQTTTRITTLPRKGSVCFRAPRNIHIYPRLNY